MTATASPTPAADAASASASSSFHAVVASHFTPSPLLPVESALLELHSSQQSLQQMLSAARSDYYQNTHPLMLEQLVPAFAQLDVYCRKMDEVKARLQRVSKRVASIKQRTAALDADVSSNSSSSSSSKQPLASPPTASPPQPAAAAAATTASSISSNG